MVKSYSPTNTLCYIYCIMLCLKKYILHVKHMLIVIIMEGHLNKRIISCI